MIPPLRGSPTFESAFLELRENDSACKPEGPIGLEGPGGM